jgi:hypothetical protein
MSKQYDISSAKLKQWGIPLAAFCEDANQAIYDAAQEIGTDKGYGSEGIGEVHSEICEDLGIDEQDVELIVPAEVSPRAFQGEDSYTFTIDGQCVDANALAIEAAEALVTSLTKRLASAKRALAKLKE